MKNMQKIIDRLKPNDRRRDNFKTKQVFRTEWYEIQDEDDIEIIDELPSFPINRRQQSKRVYLYGEFDNVVDDQK